MNIFIYTQYPFPYGLAQTNRLVAIAKGLVHAKVNLQVICIKPTELKGNIRNSGTKGDFEGVSYWYSSGTTVRNRNPFIRLFHYYFGFWRSILILLAARGNKKPQAVVVGVLNNSRYALIILTCRIRKIKVIHERSEYPFLSYSGSFMQKIAFGIYRKLICTGFDGMITITQALSDYYKPLLKPTARTCILPILVEPERFTEQVKPGKEKYIAYCGSMQGKKDGVDILIEAFYEISSQYPNLKLYLIGDTDFKEFGSLQEQIKSLKLDDKIVFTGRVERDAMPAYLLSAEVLCLARPTSKQAEGGFPTKLGEYLCSGRPVVVTKVGEIPEYLTDGENAYLAEPNDAKDFAAKLHKALADPEKSNKVGANGKKLAHEVFNYQVQGIKLADWLKNFV